MAHGPAPQLEASLSVFACLPAEVCQAPQPKPSHVYPTGFGIAVSAALLIPPWHSDLPDFACLQYYVDNIMPSTLKGWQSPFHDSDDTRGIVMNDLSCFLPMCPCHPLPDCDDTEEELDENAEEVLSVLGLPSAASPASPAVDGPVQGLLSEFFFGDAAMDHFSKQSGHCPSPYPDMVSCPSSHGGDSEDGCASHGCPSDQLQSTCGCLNPDCPGMLGWIPPSPYSDAPTWVLGACPASQAPSKAASRSAPAAVTTGIDPCQRFDARLDELMREHDTMLEEAVSEMDILVRKHDLVQLNEGEPGNDLCWPVGALHVSLYSHVYLYSHVSCSGGGAG